MGYAEHTMVAGSGPEVQRREMDRVRDAADRAESHARRLYDMTERMFGPSPVPGDDQKFEPTYLGQVRRLESALTAIDAYLDMLGNAI